MLRVLGRVTSQQTSLSVIFQQHPPYFRFFIFYFRYYFKRDLFNSGICCRASAGTFTPNRSGYYCIAAGAGCKLKRILSGALLKICLFRSFDIHLFFIAQPWYFCKFTFLIQFRNQILYAGYGIWLTYRHPVSSWEIDSKQTDNVGGEVFGR